MNDEFSDRYKHLIKSAQEEYAEEYYMYAIPGFLAKKFIGYASMRKDLTLILEYIELLKENPINPTIKSSLTYSMIALYGKCFTDASRNKFPKLEPTVLFKGKKKLQKKHLELMELRHQFIAHRGKTTSEVGIAFMLMPKEKKEENQIRFKQLKQYSFGIKKIEEIEEIVNYILKKVEKKIQKAGQRVYDGYFNLFEPKQMTLMLMNNAKEFKKKPKSE